MVSTIRQILEITKESELHAEFGQFEDSINTALLDLINQLSKDVRTTEVSSLIDHMTNVERWRERVVRFLALAAAFVSHCKSDHFTLVKTKGQTEFDRNSYQKRLLAGFGAMEIYLEGLIQSLDSRVNLCKILLRVEDSGFSAKIKG